MHGGVYLKVNYDNKYDSYKKWKEKNYDLTNTGHYSWSPLHPINFKQQNKTLSDLKSQEITHNFNISTLLYKLILNFYRVKIIFIFVSALR